MKDGIHPTYREVCFQDLSNGFKFVTRSCLQSKETIKMEDGRELPLMKLESTSETHPFYTGTQKSIDNLGGRVEKFRNKFARVGMKKIIRCCRQLKRPPKVCPKPLATEARARRPAPVLGTGYAVTHALDADTDQAATAAFLTPGEQPQARPGDAARRQTPAANGPLLLLCAAYVLPGVFGRDPWRNADLTAFGQMVAIADGRTPWWAPTLGHGAGRHGAC